MKKLTQFYIRTWNWWYRSDIASSMQLHTDNKFSLLSIYNWCKQCSFLVNFRLKYKDINKSNKRQTYTHYMGVFGEKYSPKWAVRFVYIFRPMKKLTQFYIRTWNWWYRSDIASSTNSKCSLNWKFRHPEWKSSLQKIYIYFIEITFLSQFCLFNTLFHVYPTTARMKNFAGLVKRHLARFFAVWW
jgi:hypothetical protein